MEAFMFALAKWIEGIWVTIPKGELGGNGRHLSFEHFELRQSSPG